MFVIAFAGRKATIAVKPLSKRFAPTLIFVLPKSKYWPGAPLKWTKPPSALPKTTGASSSSHVQTNTSRHMKGRCRLRDLHKADVRLEFWDTVQCGLGNYYLRDSALPDPARVPQDERAPAAHRAVQAKIDSPHCSWRQGKESASARARAESIHKSGKDTQSQVRQEKGNQQPPQQTTKQATACERTSSAFPYLSAARVHVHIDLY